MTTGVDQLPRFSEALRKAPAQALQISAAALNEAAEFARDEAIDALAARYNLSRRYISEKLVVRQRASAANLEARIVGENRAVLATRFGARPATKPAPGAKGIPAAGIPAGTKVAGSKPWSVLRGGGGKSWKNAFFIRLPGSNAWAMVARYGDGDGLSPEADWKQNLDVVNSLSVGQMWRYYRDEIGPEAMALASERFLEEIAEVLE